jgi:hypothetical protein
MHQSSVTRATLESQNYRSSKQRLEWAIAWKGLSTDETSTADIGANAANSPFAPRSVNSTSDPCCPLHEWLVFLQCGSTDLYADAAFSTLRAHAARKSNPHKGLIAAVNCGLREQQLQMRASTC